MLLYYITGRKNFSGTHEEQVARTIAHIRAAAQAGVDMIQLREKDLSGAELRKLSAAALQACRQGSSNCKLLINSRTDIALAAGLDGVHLTSHDVSPDDVRSVARSFASTGRSSRLVVGVSCHTGEEVFQAGMALADFVVFGPVFGKNQLSGMPNDPQEHRRLEALASVCPDSFIPVLALGGVTLESASACMEAGAAGVAGIRLFQFDDAEDPDLLLQKMRRRVKGLRNCGAPPATR